MYCLTATDTAEIVMCAMNSGTSESKRVLFEFFDRQVSLSQLDSSLLIKSLWCFKDWRILSVTYVQDHSGVVINVKGCSILVLRMKIFSGCWKVLEIFLTDISDIWFRTSVFNL